MDIKGVRDKSTSFKENGEIAVSDNQAAESRSQGEGGNDGGIKPEKVYSKEEISSEIEHLNKWLESKSSHLKFVLHEKLNKYYVQVVSDSTNEVIKEIPSKKIMDVVANFYEKLGLIVDEKV